VTFIIINIVKLVLMLLMLNHVLAALWWVIGSLGQSSSLKNWIDERKMDDEGLGYRYLTSLHWSICMFTPGSMSVQPENVWERLYAITILVFGMVVFTSFISSMSASISQLKSMHGDRGKDLWMLRRFLRQHSLAQEHSYRILRYVDNALHTSKNDKIPANKVNALKLLTDQLRYEIDYVVNYPCLCVHPVFQCIVEISQVTMYQLVGTALSQRPLARNDALFSGGGSATHMHMVVAGELNYIKTFEIKLMDCKEYVVKDDWLCEAVLWTPWSHVGFARASISTDLVSIKSQGFLDIIKMDAQIVGIICRYAQRFVRELSVTGRGLLTDVYKSGSASEHALKLLDDDFEVTEPTSHMPAQEPPDFDRIQSLQSVQSEMWTDPAGQPGNLLLNAPRDVRKVQPVES